MLFPIAFASATAISPGIYETASLANVRTAPRMWSKRLGFLMIGQRVEVRRVSGEWCDIKFGSLTHAYVHCTLLKNVSADDFGGVQVEKDANGAWVLGSPDAPVLIEEYGDMQCPFCANYYNQTFLRIFSDYIENGKVRYVYYNFPLSFHAQAQNAAMASLCAGDQGRYWRMHELLLTDQSRWVSASTAAVFTELALEEGLDSGMFAKCMDSEKYAQQVSDEMSLGMERGVTGTPDFFVNGEEIMGAQPYEVFVDAIERELE